MRAIEISQQQCIGILMRTEMILVNKDDVERFEGWSSTYEHSWVQRYFDQVHTFVLETVVAEVPGLDPEVVLDVGCGTGRLLRRAANLWPEAQLVGVDPASGMIESHEN
jgi:ubiquinone/menaquinone biosynthesis C-methylase UbiE